MRDIIAIDIKPDCLIDSLGNMTPTDSLEHILDFCIKDMPNIFVIVWNLYQLVDLIRRFISEDEYKTLLEKDKVWVGQADNRYKLFSSEGKRLCIGHEYKTNTHANFYTTTKMEQDIFNLCRFFPNFKPSNVQDILNKGKELLTALETLGMGNTDTLASAINIFDKSKLADTFIPHLYDMPESALNMAEYAMPLLIREWRAVYKIGCWTNDNKATDLDLHAGYPSLVKDFGDLSDCKIWYSKYYQPCDWGIFKGYINITTDKHPIINTDKQPIRGKYLDYITSDQWAYLKKYNWGFFEPIDGWLLRYNNKEKPFEKLMTNLYQQRQQGGLISDICKGIAVGLVGMLAQTYENRHGNHFNPFYSVMATSRCSLKVAKFIEVYKLWDNLINVVVDGCLIDKPLEIQDTKEIGSWHSEQVNALVLSLGHSYVGSKHPDNHTFEDMMLAIKANPKLISYNDVILLPETNTTNRIFDDYPKSGRDWITNKYESRAIEIKG